MKLLFYTNIPSPYFVEYVNELGKYAEIIVVFEKESFAHRDNSWKNFNADNFSFFFLNGISITKTQIIDLKSYRFIKDNPDALVIIANPLTPVGMQCIEYCKRHKRPYVLQSEGGIPKNGKGIKESIKKYFLRGASLYLSGMKSKSDYFAAYGVDPKIIKTYPFASLHEKELITDLITAKEKNNIKNELSINYDKVVLFVGRIIYGKGIDILIKACENMPVTVGIYIVGGKACEPYISLAKRYRINSIHYIPHTSLNTLKKFYLAADVMVLPTRGDTWGLVINEAMSFGLPVITTKNCVAGLQLIQDGKNGFLIDNEDYVDLRLKLETILNNESLSHEMSLNNLQKIKDYTYENMAKVIFDYLKELRLTTIDNKK